jgi:hypothetical protein
MNGRIGQLANALVSRLPDRIHEALTRYGLFMLSRSGLRKVPVSLWHGQMDKTGRVGRLLVAGDDPWVEYLPKRFFFGEPKREPLGRATVRSLPRFLEQFQESTDLTIARVDRLSGHTTFSHHYLAVPEWVGTRLTVPDNLEVLVRSSSNLQRDVRRIRRHKYEPVVSFGDEDIHVFYHSFYLPLSKARYGDLLVVRPAHDLRDRVRRGGILWVQRERERVAALLFEQKGGTLDVLAVGTMDGDPKLMKEGAIAALYYFVIEFARMRGCRTVDFRGSRPSLNDGVLRYKSKWGATLYDKVDSYHDLFVRWGQVNEVVKEFLSHTPLIFRDEGGFSALIGNENPSEHELWVDGLRRWYRLTETGVHEILRARCGPPVSPKSVPAVRPLNG